MRNFKGGMLDSSAADALAAGLCGMSDGSGAEGAGGDGEGAGGGGAGGSGGGGAEDLLDDGDAGSGDGDGAAKAPSADADPDAHDGSIIDVPEHLKPFSPEKKDGKLSNQEWLAKIGIKDLDNLADRYREAEKALREGGRIKIPGEGASEDELKTFREAMGVPEAADKYEVALPTAAGVAGNFEVDKAFAGPLAEIAHQHHVPGPAFKALADKFMELQADSIANEAVALTTDRDAYFQKLGTEAETRKAEFKRGAELMGLDKATVAKIQAGAGVAATIDMIAKVGQAAGEDFFAGGGGGKQFGVASAAEAQSQLDTMINDKDTAARIRTKQEPDYSKYKRLIGAKAHFAEVEQRGRK